MQTISTNANEKPFKPNKPIIKHFEQMGMVLLLDMTLTAFHWILEQVGIRVVLVLAMRTSLLPICLMFKREDHLTSSLSFYVVAAWSISTL